MKHATRVVFFLLLTGCAAAPKSPSSEPASPASAPTAAGAASTPAGYPQTAPVTPSPAPEPSPAQAEAPTLPSRKADEKSGASKDTPGASRSTAEVRGDLERAQRELDVAGSDCRNACRALGSMDRAVGRLCTLARSSDERGRCDDASAKVKSARDKVKRTCTSCPDVSVERDAAIPSR